MSTPNTPAISAEMVRHVAALARLTLTEAEVAHYQTAMEKILKSFETLKQYSVTQIPTAQDPMVHTESDNVLYTGPAENLIELKAFLKQVPKREGAFVCVPGILDATT